MSVLITGGAGFVGSFTAKLCAESGFDVVVLDNLTTGNRDHSRWGAFYGADVRHMETVAEVIASRGITTVVHLAASANVAESIANPAQYYSNNVSGAFALFDAMISEGVRRIVFASSCSVYGNASSQFISEEHATVPVSTYGESKLIAEHALQRYEHAYGLQSVVLRYFNVAGADAEVSLGEDPRTSCRIIPRAFQAAKSGGPFQIFGTSFDTANGTAVRDYVHVRDIAMANLLAIRYLEAGEPSTVVNLGAGIGLSVRQIVDEVGRVLGEAVPVREGPSRIGDPAYAVADASKAEQVLGWRPAHSTLEEIVGFAVACYSVRRDAAGGLPESGPENARIAILR